MTGPTARRSTAGVAVGTFACLAAVAWARPLMLPDEGRYVGVAWEMLRSGDWLTPTLNGLPYFHKPPLFYWVTAASMAAFGPGEAAARAAPLAGAWLGAMSTFLLVRRWWGARPALLTLALLLAMPLFYLGGQFANLDMLVAGLVTAATAALAHAALSFERGLPWRGWLAAGWTLAALAVLAKGLVGVVLPLAVVGAWLLSSRRWRALRALLASPAVLAFFAVAAPWFFAMQSRFPGFLDYFFVVQHFRRYAGAGFNNVQPAWFFPALLALASLPWLGWLRAQFARGRWRDAERGALRALALAWVVVVVAFFSLPRSKLIGYVLPAVPPLALLLADGFETIEARLGAASRRAWAAACGVGVAASLAVVAVLALHPSRSTREIGLVLRQHAAAGEPVVMLDDYRFDLPLVARLREPVIVVGAWSGADVHRRDDWRKELADAGAFAPAAAAAWLVDPAALCARLAGHGAAWVVGDATAADRFAFLKAAAQIASVRGSALWRVDRTDPALSRADRCEERPNGDSPSM